MANIGAVMLMEEATVKPDQVSLSKKEQEKFSEMLAVFLGKTCFSVDKLLEDASVEKQDIHCSLEGNKEIDKNDLRGLLVMLNPGLWGELPEEEAAVLSKGEGPWFEHIKQNITLGKFFEKPSVESRQLYEKLEKLLQQNSLNLKELNFLQEIKEKIELQELQANQDRANFDFLKAEKFTTREKSTIESESFNLGEREILKDSEEIKEAKQLNFNNELKEINKLPEKEASLKNEFINQEESWAQIFSTKASENMKNTVGELRLNTENLARDLPEIVLSQIKTLQHLNGSKDVIIHLEPKELGKLVVKLTSEEGIVSVKFVAHYPVTRNLLESGLDNLRQSFVEQGISFDRLDVELGGQQLEQNQYQHQQQLMWSEKQSRTERSGEFAERYFEKSLSEVKPDGFLKLGTYDYLV
ncbi:MAG: flagellar hook-length control protein FliK [Peptococcia bacterium]